MLAAPAAPTAQPYPPSRPNRTRGQREHRGARAWQQPLRLIEWRPGVRGPTCKRCPRCFSRSSSVLRKPTRRRSGCAPSAAASMWASHHVPGCRPRQAPHQGPSMSLQAGHGTRVLSTAWSARATQRARESWDKERQERWSYPEACTRKTAPDVPMRPQARHARRPHLWQSGSSPASSTPRAASLALPAGGRTKAADSGARKSSSRGRSSGGSAAARKLRMAARAEPGAPARRAEARTAREERAVLGRRRPPQRMRSSQVPAMRSAGFGAPAVHLSAAPSAGLTLAPQPAAALAHLGIQQTDEQGHHAGAMLGQQRRATLVLT